MSFFIFLFFIISCLNSTHVVAAGVTYVKDKEGYVCEHCFSTYAHWPSFSRHKRIDTNGSSTCCDRINKNNEKIKKKKTEKSPPYESPISQGVGMEYDDNYEDEQDLSVCSVCYEEFVTFEELQEHLGGVKVTCTHCGRDDINKPCLNGHTIGCVGHKPPVPLSLLPMVQGLLTLGAGTKSYYVRR